MAPARGSVFDGMAGILTEVFGAPVTYLPQGGGAEVITSVFREGPTEARDADGHPVIIIAPTWSLPARAVSDIRRGDRIRPGNGRTYEVLNAEPSGSPAGDARILCELFEVLA